MVEPSEMVRDIVGLYVNLPERAVVLSVDERNQIQALDRTQPGLPLKKGRCGTMTHDYKRNGTMTLFAALNVLEGNVIGRCMQRHTHQEFIRFLNANEKEVPANKQVHVVLDNYATHKHLKVVEWLGRHDRSSPFLSRPPRRPGANLQFRLDQRRRGLLCQADQPNTETWRVPLDHSPPGRHQPLRQRGQPEPKAIPMDQEPGRDHRHRPAWAPSNGFAPLA